MARKLDERTKRTRAINRKLAKMYPEAECALQHGNPLELLISTILSAQCTDKRVNMVTPALFEKYPTAEDFATCRLGDLERMIRSTGFYRNKSKNIKACCQKITAEFRGKVPGSMEQLLELPGVARKTANVVLGNAFGVPGITVDTHMIRLSKRMGLTDQKDPVKIEQDLSEQLQPKEWTIFSHRMIHHGRQICSARKPLCEQCQVKDLCPKIGVSS